MTEETTKTIDLLECFSCGSKHEGVPLHEYNCPSPPWTHHYVCPSSGDPVSIATAEVDGKPTIIHQDIANGLSVARRAGHYLVAIFHKKDPGVVTDKKPLMLNLRTENFDLSWGNTAWMMLRDQLRKMEDETLGVDQVDENDYPRPTPIDFNSLPGLNLFSDPELTVPFVPLGKSPIETATEQIEIPADVPPTGFGSIQELYEDKNKREM